MILREVVKLRTEVAGLKETIEALQRRMDQQPEASINARSASHHFRLSSREELDALEVKLANEEHRSGVVRRRKGRKGDKEVNLGYFVPVCYFVLGERDEGIKGRQTG